MLTHKIVSAKIFLFPLFTCLSNNSGVARIFFWGGGANDLDFPKIQHQFPQNFKSGVFASAQFCRGKEGGGTDCEFKAGQCKKLVYFGFFDK